MADEQGKEARAPRRIPMSARKSKVEIGDVASMPSDLSWYGALDKMIPRILAGKDLSDLRLRVVDAVRSRRPFVVMMGAHVVKCGLGRLIAELVGRGVVSAVAMNGACAIHDVELAIWGKTSEDVGEGLRTGEFLVVEHEPGLGRRGR